MVSQAEGRQGYHRLQGACPCAGGQRVARAVRRPSGAACGLMRPRSATLTPVSGLSRIRVIIAGFAVDGGALGALSFWGAVGGGGREWRREWEA